MVQKYEAILKQALELPLPERAAMIEALAASFQFALRFTDDDTPLTDAQIAELMHSEPLSPDEIIAQGLTGTWANLDIEDSAVSS